MCIWVHHSATGMWPKLEISQTEILLGDGVARKNIINGFYYHFLYHNYLHAKYMPRIDIKCVCLSYKVESLL